MIPRAALARTKLAKADKRRRSRSVEHDVRAKQTKVCDAEQAGFQTSMHAPNYIKTDEQLIVHGLTAYSIPPLTASLAAVFPPVDNILFFC